MSKRKRARKFRGSRTHGCGSHKKRRGGGSRGGRGMAGSFKHKKLMILKEKPEHFVKGGFKRKNVKKINAINLKDLDIIAKKLGTSKLNISELGYDKVLGTGKLTQKLTIEAERFTEKAKSKIEKMGGKVVELS